jgi:cyclohexyl-isocyanide hydratase
MSEAGEDRPFVIVIPIYEGVDLIDVAAPYEVFNWMAESWKERKVEYSYQISTEI